MEYHAYKAITTKFNPATNTRGARITAYAEGGRNNPHKVSISYPHEKDAVAAHAEAAEFLCRKLNWSGKLIPGATYDGNYVWVFAEFHDSRSNRK